MFRRANEKTCFYCSSHSSNHRDPLNWRCESCGCWNRYDQSTGEILSYEPAMREESLNSNSFKRRGSPSKHTLPTMYPTQIPFCRSCQTNQMMLMNLLSDYLPPQESPEYASRMESLPAYQASLEARYPQVCDACHPIVQEKIREQNSMARSSALGNWLQNTKSRDIQRQRSVSVELPKATPLALPAIQLFAWRLRGILWFITLLTSVLAHFNGLFQWYSLNSLTPLRPILPFLSILSILWTAWDPYYATRRHAERHGRDLRVKGKEKYIRFQMLAWLCRFTTSFILAMRWDARCLQYPLYRTVYFSSITMLEVFCLVASWAVLRLTQPPAIRLIETSGHKEHSIDSPSPDRATSAPPAERPTSLEGDMFSGLTLSSQPVMPSPVFGIPSMKSSTTHRSTEQDENAMDWSPTNPGQASSSSGHGDAASYIRTQKFFPKEQPTGLEALFAKAATIGDGDATMATLNSPNKLAGWTQRIRLAALLALLAPLLFIGARISWLWLFPSKIASSNMPSIPMPGEE